MAKADGSKDNRGGARQGAGRPKQTKHYSDRLKADVDKNVRLMAKETGKSFGRVLCELAWNPELAPQFKSPYLKLIADIQCVKEAHKQVEINDKSKPTIYLPETMPKPAEAEEKEKEALSVH